MSPMPPAHSLPPGIATPGDYAAHASARLDDNAWAYLAGAAGDEITHHENRQAFDRLRLNPRVLADVTGGHTRVELFGRTHAHPILLAPVAYQRLFHPDGELASAQAAAAQGTTLVVSTLASHRLEDIAAAAAGGPPPWFQLYFQADRGHTRHLLARAEASGYQALVVTVDAPINGIRDREQRAGFHLPPHVAPVNLFGMTPPAPPPLAPGQSRILHQLMGHAPTWRDLAWLRETTSLPIVLKGVLAPDDARRAADLGLDGVLVSNHGGRTLDTLPASLEALPAIADAVGDRLAVLLDGGIRRGTDILKARALGARAVLIGRAYLHGLAVAGPLGVAHVIRLLRDELEAALALTGRPALDDVGHDILFQPRIGGGVLPSP